VVKAFVGEGLVLASVGLLLGMAGAAAVTRVLSSRLFGVTPLDTTTFSVVAVVLVAVAALAALVPATGAAKTHPVEALRGE
jgi:putative ABC transport system permease protein